jgi:RNA-directed DNA polymerase
MRLQQIIQKATSFRTIKNDMELGVLLKTHPATMALCCLQPQYKIYTLPKKNGSFRTIEDPGKKLKAIQRILNDYLQAWYHTKKTNHVHGFVLASASDTETKGILSNAAVHLGKPFLLNIDLQDFFHQISRKLVWDKLRKILPAAETGTITLLSKLTTFKERLPMGAPTSPVLSNICSMALDDVLIAVSKKMGYTYSRFADDLSFSSMQSIGNFDREVIVKTIQEQGLNINHQKTKLFQAGETKLVTGLVLEETKVALPAGYLPQLYKEMERYQATREVEFRYRTGMRNNKLKLFEQELQGKINFAQMILGSTDTAVLQLYQQWDAVHNDLQSFESADWLEIPYNFY